MIQIAMQIILHAGNAREEIGKAVEAIHLMDKEEYQRRICNAKEMLRKAHVSQTNVIQEEAQGEHHEINVLFIHAQDTLMTIMSELNMVENFSKTLFSLKEEVLELEAKK